MSSTTQLPPVSVSGLMALGREAAAATRAFAGALAADPALLAELPDELLESLTLTLHAARDAAESSATVLTGRVDRFIGGVRGRLVAGRYPSTAQFLVAEAGMSLPHARATVGRGRALQRDYAVVADGWLAGRIPGGAVTALTVGVEDVLRRSTRRSTPVSREQVLADLVPIAEAGDLVRLEVEVRLKRLAVDPDGCDEEALFAFENQNLSIVEHGSMFRITGDLTPEVAAATRTVLEAAAARIVTEQLGDLHHDTDCELLLTHGSGCTCGELDRARRAAGLRDDQLRARALGEVMTDQLDAGALGSHHGVARHVTLVGDITDAAAPLTGRLAVPGQDHDVLLPPTTMARLLCDSEVTRVLTTTDVPATVDLDSPDEQCEGSHGERERAFLRAVTTTLAGMARNVLYVGRSQRTVSARLRRILEARDGHCAFPGCHAHTRRCEAHHVTPWEHGGPTSMDNLALLCIAHHHAVHEGGWTMQLTHGATGHETGCWEFTPPPLRRRRLRP
jgi:hypothetical protein